MNLTVDDLLDRIKELSTLDVSTTPNMIVFDKMVAEFERQNIPSKFCGKIEINVCKEFLEDEEKVDEIVRLMVQMVSRIYVHLKVKYHEDCDQYFADMIDGNFSLDYNYG